jgi:hypothetical protein
LLNLASLCKKQKIEKHRELFSQIKQKHPRLRIHAFPFAVRGPRLPVRDSIFLAANSSLVG